MIKKNNIKYNPSEISFSIFSSWSTDFETRSNGVRHDSPALANEDELNLKDTAFILLRTEKQLIISLKFLPWKFFQKGFLSAWIFC